MVLIKTLLNCIPHLANRQCHVVWIQNCSDRGEPKPTRLNVGVTTRKAGGRTSQSASALCEELHAENIQVWNRGKLQVQSRGGNGASVSQCVTLTD